MKEISHLYQNDFGVAFYWVKEEQVLSEKVQLVFKETGFYLSDGQLESFRKKIQMACNSLKCSDCELRGQCHKYLLETPFQGLELPVSQVEMLQLKDLVCGTLFQIGLFGYLNDLCKN